MSFKSILFDDCDDLSIKTSEEAPDFFGDLNLDQVIESITSPKNEYNLKSFFYSTLHDKKLIHFRQAIFRELENKAIYDMINQFAEKMVIVRRYLKMVNGRDYRYHQEGWFLEAAFIYCEAVNNFFNGLSSLEISSKGFKELRDYFQYICHSAQFKTLYSDMTDLKTKITSIQYSIILRNNHVKIRKYMNEIEYSKEVEKIFNRFRQGNVKNYIVDIPPRAGMNHVEAQILHGVAKLHPEIFKQLDQFYLDHNNFLDQGICTFDREIQFYIAYFDFISKIKGMGLKFCYPRILEKEKNICATAAYDIALANKNYLGDSPIVSNDFFLEGKERIFVVTGPNQGGKTTFARMVGQLHFFARLGCPVSARTAKLFLNDQIFTHFEKTEDISNLRGKLKDDLVRIHVSLQKATPQSIFIINEIFTSTSLHDAIFLGTQILEKIIKLDSLCVFVTFIDELTNLGEATVSMMSSVLHDNPTVRTFKIERKPADGLSYAICIAEKHQLTYAKIKDRIKNAS